MTRYAFANAISQTCFSSTTHTQVVEQKKSQMFMRCETYAEKEGVKERHIQGKTYTELQTSQIGAYKYCKVSSKPVNALKIPSHNNTNTHTNINTRTQTQCTKIPTQKQLKKPSKSNLKNKNTKSDKKQTTLDKCLNSVSTPIPKYKRRANTNIAEHVNTHTQNICPLSNLSENDLLFKESDDDVAAAQLRYQVELDARNWHLEDIISNACNWIPCFNDEPELEKARLNVIKRFYEFGLRARLQITTLHIAVHMLDAMLVDITKLKDEHKHIYTHTYKDINENRHINTNTDIDINTNNNIHTNSNIHINNNIHTNSHIHINSHTNIHTNTHTHTYTNIHTYKHELKNVLKDSTQFVALMACCFRYAVKLHETAENVMNNAYLPSDAISLLKYLNITSEKIDTHMFLKWLDTFEPIVAAHFAHTPHIPVASDWLYRFMVVGGWPTHMLKQYSPLAEYLLSLAFMANGPQSQDNTNKDTYTHANKDNHTHNTHTNTNCNVKNNSTQQYGHTNNNTYNQDGLYNIPPSTLAAAALCLTVKIINADDRSNGVPSNYTVFPPRLMTYTRLSSNTLKPIMRSLGKLLFNKPQQATAFEGWFGDWAEQTWGTRQ